MWATVTQPGSPPSCWPCSTGQVMLGHTSPSPTYAFPTLLQAQTMSPWALLTLTGPVMNQHAEYKCPTTSRSVLHFMCLFPLPQETSGVTPPASQTVDMGFAPIAEVLSQHTKPLLFPGNRGLKAGQSRGLHTAASLPWLGPTDVYLSKQPSSDLRH